MERPWTYRDPVDLVWLGTAARLGWQVARSPEVYASWDGRAVLTLSDPEGFDPDDSLAQMIFHEICHALVEAPVGLRRVDWGLENIDDRDLVREHACHRLQAALADPWGLREFMAVTTVWRPYYDALPPHPLAPCDDPALPLARDAWRRATQGPWAAPLREALAATAAIAAATRPFASPPSLWARSRAPHPLGLPPGPEDHSCGDCGWRDGATCRQVGAALERAWPACSRWEPPITAQSCGACGACCREAFHQVPVEPGEPMAEAHPEWVARDEHGLHLPRPGGRCPPLRGDGREAPFRCAAYDLRPQSCRDFEPGSDNCLEARRRVGLSA